MDQDEYEDYEALIKSDGWKRFSEHVADLWGTMANGGGSRFQQAVSQASGDTSDPDALAKLRQIIVAQREIQQLILHPVHRCQQLKPHGENVAAFTGSRRGSL